MSDGMSDAYKDAGEYEWFVQYLKEVLRWFQDQTDSRHERVFSEKKLVTVRRIFGPEVTAEELTTIPLGLLENNKGLWTKLLMAVPSSEKELFKSFKKLSPFSDKIFIVVNYGRGFVNFEGETEIYFKSLIKDKEWRTYDCDKYAVLLPMTETPPEVIWVNEPKKK